jgi:hypothetical protein
MIPPIYQLLKANAPVTAIVNANNIYFIEAPENINPTTPYIVWTAPDIEPENQLSDVPDIDKASIHINCYHPDQKVSVDLAKAIRDAIEPSGHMLNAFLNERDAKTKMYNHVLIFDYFLPRN